MEGKARRRAWGETEGGDWRPLTFLLNVLPLSRLCLLNGQL
jgi:hypothetical protein